MTPQFGLYDFFLVVTNRSSSGPKHLVADVYVNRNAKDPGIRIYGHEVQS